MYNILIIFIDLYDIGIFPNVMLWRRSVIQEIIMQAVPGWFQIKQKKME